MHTFTSLEKYEELRLKKELWLNLYRLSNMPLCKHFADRMQQRLASNIPALPVIPVPEFDGSEVCVMDKHYTQAQGIDFHTYALLMNQLTPSDFIKEVEEQN
jgi:hypothetical protein